MLFTKAAPTITKINSFIYRALLILCSLPERLAASERFTNAVQNSSPQNAEIESNNALMTIVMGLLTEKTEFARNYFENSQFRAFVNQRVFHRAYDQARTAYPLIDGHSSTMIAAKP